MTPEQYAKMHKEAFRSAFNFLNMHFPPGQDDAWWDRTAKDCSATSIEAGENILVMELLIAVMNYLEDERKKRGENDGETDG